MATKYELENLVENLRAKNRTLTEQLETEKSRGYKTKQLDGIRAQVREGVFYLQVASDHDPDHIAEQLVLPEEAQALVDFFVDGLKEG